MEVPVRQPVVVQAEEEAQHGPDKRAKARSTLRHTLTGILVAIIASLQVMQNVTLHLAELYFFTEYSVLLEF